MRCSKFWKRESAEALSRTLIDLVLFDRLEAHQEELAARNLLIRGECRIEAHTATKREEIVTGDADWVLGYDPATPTGPKDDSESCSVQRRMGLSSPKRVVDTVDGMVSDGINWQFLWLEERSLRISDRILTLTERGRSSINWNGSRDVETAICGSIPLKLEKSPTTPDKACLVDDGDDDHDVGSLDEVEEFEIVRPGPSLVKLPIRPKSPTSSGPLHSNSVQTSISMTLVTCMDS
ncbi:hypothetical protein VTN00DRAFT_3021 [Thermoascus crustaceus]|uniref:uncharacterized protein n=1 Tax=Thermoascus crustaceus TaxID=5088 RepID=UPI003744502A